MSERKTININPDLLSFKSASGTRKRKSKLTGDPNEKSPSKRKREDSLKKRSILKMIRQRQEEMYKSMFDKSSNKESTVEDLPINKEFKEAELFFQNLTEKKNEEMKRNATIRRHPTQPNSLLLHPSISNIVPINIELPSTLALPSNNMIIKPREAPQYGCLKNGTLPTYRSYMNRTMKNLSDETRHEILSGSCNNDAINPQIGGERHAPSSQEKTMNDRINESLKRVSEITQTETKLKQINNLKKPMVKKQRKIKTRTYKVGKSKVLPKVSVLVSNKTIRNKVSTQSQLLKQMPIQDVKKYLMKRGLIKVGSTAPQDILRKMYESSIMMCGEIKNHNPDNLLYNFIYGGGEH